MSEANADLVSVVACTHTVDRRALLLDLVASIARGTLQPTEVVIVVDRNPALLESLSSNAWPLPVRVIASPGSGLAAARNAGWQATTSRLVAFIDDDAVASEAWLEELVEAVDRHDAGVVGGDISPRWAGGAAPSWYTPRLGWIVGCSYDGMPKEPARVRNVIGCNMLFKRDLLEQLGGFDVGLGRTDTGLAGCEETELCIRANRAGASVVLIPGAAVSQVLPADRKRFGYAIRRGWGEGRSKRRLVALHGEVLGTETTYTRALVRQALRLLASGVIQRRLDDLRRSAALLLVLGATGTSYLVHGLPRPSRSRPARLPVRG